MKKFLLFFAFLATIQSVLAQPTEIEVDGIFYRLQSDLTARVIKPNDITYSGVIKIPAQIDYRGRLYNVDCAWLSSAFQNSQITELHFAEGIKKVNTWLYNVPNLNKVVLPSTLNEHSDIDRENLNSRCQFRLSENAVSYYVVDYGERVKICVERFNVYDTDGNKLTPYVYDCATDEKYYPDKNGLIGPFDKRLDSDMVTNGCDQWVTNKLGYYWVTLLYCDVKGTRVQIRGESPLVTTGNKFFSGGLRYDILPEEKSVCVSRDISIQHNGDIKIPGRVTHGGKNYPVEAIGSWAFMNSDISSVTFPQTMRHIGDPNPRSYSYNSYHSEAFRGCKNLKEIHFNEGLISIDGGAFQSCTALESVNLPKSLHLIGVSAFWCCFSLKKLIIQGNRTKLYSNAFNSCDNLKAIFLFSERPLDADNCFSEITYKNAVLYVPTGTKELYEYHPEWKRFRYIEECTPADIDKIDVDKVDNYITEVNGLKYRCHSDTNTATLIGYDDSKITKYLILPESIHLSYDNKDYRLTTIGIEAFARSKVLEGIDLNAVTEIETRAFTECATLFNVEMPNVENIGNNAFERSRTLERVAMNKVKVIGSNAFNYCQNLSEVIMPEVEVIGYSAFYNCSNIKNISAPKAKKIEKSAFSACNKLVKVDMPQLTHIDEKAFEFAFSNYSFDQIEINMPNVKSIGKNAFSSCRRDMGYYYKMCALNFPKLESIESDAFYNTVITSLMLGPISAINTSYYAAYNFIVPNKYNEDVYGFDIYLASESVPNIWEEGQKELFSDDCYEYCALIVPLGCGDAYRKDLHEDRYGKQYGWGRFKTIWEVDFTDMLAKIEVPLEEKTHSAMIDGIWYTVNNEDNTASVDSLSSESMTHVFVPEKISAYTRDYRVTRISDEAFSGSKIESIEMNSIETIGANAFSACMNLKKVETRNAVEIESGAFSYCPALEEIDIANVKKIGQWVFKWCDNLKKVIANNAKEIDTNAFSNSNIEYLEINNAKWMGFCAVESVKNVYVLSYFPPYLDPYNSDYVINDATLYVPVGRKAVYESDPEWGRYVNIVEVGDSGVDNVSVDNTSIPAGYYDLNGIRHDSPQPGFNIMIDNEGNVEKRIFK